MRVAAGRVAGCRCMAMTIIGSGTNNIAGSSVWIMTLVIIACDPHHIIRSMIHGCFGVGVGLRQHVLA